MSGTAVVRVGGQALADGVLMRTSRAWAVAREDGSVSVGDLPPRRWANVPVLRVLAGLATGLRLGVSRGLFGRRGTSASAAAGARRRNYRFLLALVAVEAAGMAFSSVVSRRSLPVGGSVVATVGPWVLAFAVLRAVAPASLWRYHGAEHKAVAAYEAGVDLHDVGSVLAAPRVHDRCGTNLVFLAMLGGLLLTRLSGVLQLPGFLLLFGSAAEVVTLAAGRSGSWAGRVVLAGGRAIQCWVTTAEPTFDEQAVGCRALVACLEHHDRLARRSDTRRGARRRGVGV